MPDLSYLGKLVYEARTKAGISSTKLCYGLCSNSLLSRIENGERVPNLFLFLNLMERAEAPTEDIIFLCSKREARLFALINDGRFYNNSIDENTEEFFKEFGELVDMSNNMEAQHFYFHQARITTDPKERYDHLIKALECTIPEVDLENISSYCLSRTEGSIINYILNYLFMTDTRLAEKLSMDLVYRYKKHPESYYHRLCSYIHEYGLVVCSILNDDMDEALHLSKRFFKSYDADVSDNFEETVAKYSYQLGYSELALDKAASGINVITSYYLHKAIGNDTKADLVREDAKNDFGYEFDIEFI
jgi:transcriptional regulator with XRE-family HTH domain